MNLSLAPIPDFIEEPIRHQPQHHRLDSSGQLLRRQYIRDHQVACRQTLFPSRLLWGLRASTSLPDPPRAMISSAAHFRIDSDRDTIAFKNGAFGCRTPAITCSIVFSGISIRRSGRKCSTAAAPEAVVSTRLPSKSAVCAVPHRTAHSTASSISVARMRANSASA